MPSTDSKTEHPRDDEEFYIFMERFMHFMNLWTVYSDYLSRKYVPSVKPVSTSGEWETTGMQTTLMFVLYAFFYSLIEDSDKSLNGFRIWRLRYPEEETAIAAVESQVLPFRERLRAFRNRIGFHGSRSRKHQERGLELFIEHSGSEIFEAIKNFKSLGAALAAKSNARNGIRRYDEERIRRWIDSITERARIVNRGKQT